MNIQPKENGIVGPAKETPIETFSRPPMYQSFNSLKNPPLFNSTNKVIDWKFKQAKIKNAKNLTWKK